MGSQSYSVGKNMVTNPVSEITVVSPLSALRPCLAIALGMGVGRHKGQKYGEKAVGAHGDQVSKGQVGQWFEKFEGRFVLFQLARGLVKRRGYGRFWTIAGEHRKTL